MIINGNGTMRQIIAGALIAIFGAAIGFGSSWLLAIQSIDAKIDANTHDIASLKEADITIRLEQAKDIIRTDKEISNVFSLFQTNMDLQRELLGQVKVQNELLRQHR